MPTSNERKQQPNPDHDEHAADTSVSTQVANQGEEASASPEAPAEEQTDARARPVHGANGHGPSNGNGHAQNGLQHAPGDTEPAEQPESAPTAAEAQENPDGPTDDADAAENTAEQDAGNPETTDPQTTERETATELPRNAVKIKGRPGGVSLEIGEGDWAQMLALLAERLAAAEGFFRGGRVVLEAGERSLDEEQLRQVRNLLEERGMKLGVVRSTADRTLQAALEVGLSTKNDDSAPVPEASQPAPQPEAPVHPPVKEAPLPKPPAHFVYRGSLRSGQVLRKAESIVIIGDVNPGAQVISSGDIMVWGRLRGIARAGVDGNQQAVVAALDFIPTQLRIANVTAVPPEKKRSPGIFFWRKSPKRRPEIARILDGRIVVEPWDESKRNRMGSPGR